MLSEDMWDNLNRYYAWTRINDPADVGYPHETPFRRLLGSAVGAEQLSDDEAMHIDHALSALYVEYPEEHKIVELVHKHGRTLRQLEKHGKGSRHRNGQLLNSAHKFIWGFICAVS